MHILDINATSVSDVVQAGLEAPRADHRQLRQVADPNWKDDEGMKQFTSSWRSTIPGDEDSSFIAYGYSTSALMVRY